MSPSFDSQTMQFIALFLATIEFILAIYILILNVFHTANRHASGFLLLGTIATFAYGLMVGASNVEQATWPSYFLAATVSAVQPMQLITTIVLLKPDWLKRTTPRQRQRTRAIWWLVYALVLLPGVLTLVDLNLGTELWFTGLNESTYTGGVVASDAYADGSLAGILNAMYVQLLPLSTLVTIVVIAIQERDSTGPTSRLAWLLVAQNVFTLIVMLGLLRGGIVDRPIPELLTMAGFVLTYAYVAFRQMGAEGRAPRGALRPRLTALVMVVVIPLLIMVTALGSVRAADEIEENTIDQLEATNRSLLGNVSIWLELHNQALQNLVTLPDIVSMDPEAQRPILESMATNYPHVHLVSTIDRTGVNVARSDGQENIDYSDRPWFYGAWLGQTLSYHTEPDRITGETILVTAAPIRDDANNLVGIGMFSSHIHDLASEVAVSRVGDTGYAYIVDAENKLVAHPDMQVSTGSEEAKELVDMSDAPAVAMLRAGDRGFIEFQQYGETWQGYVEELDNGWGVIVQQSKAELVDIQWSLHRMSLYLVGAGALILLILTWLTIFQAFRPINTLTRIASAISAGDMTAVAPVESEDEIGMLARSFNSMTTQLRDLIGSLEKRVADRTLALEASADDLARRQEELELANQRQAEINQQLEATVVQSQRRAALLQAGTQVSRAIGQVRELDKMLPEVTQLISQFFGFYHVGVFLLDDARQYAVLRAANSLGGQKMLARGHKLAVGSEGIVGYVTDTGQPRIAVDVAEDTVHFAPPELPNTKSEMAVPLRIGNEILGALDVQSVEELAFGGEDLAALTTLAEQIAIAIQNARLFRETQDARAQAEEAQRRYLQQAWSNLQRQESADFYEYTSGTNPVGNELLPEIKLALETGEPVTMQDNGHPWANAALATPIKFRDQIIGVIGLHQTQESRKWSPDEISLVQDVAEQIGLALENARLFEQTERRAQREALIGQIVSRVRQSATIDGIMQTAVRELGKALGSPHTFVHLTSSLRPQPAQEVNDDRN